MNSLKLFFAVIVMLIVASAQILAQNPKKVQSVPRKIETPKIDPKKLFDPQKVTKDFSGVMDLGVKEARLSWVDYGQAGFVLDVIPVLTKNSRSAKIYALDKGGKVRPLTITVEALDKNGKSTSVTCEEDLLGWTVEETETNYPVCSFYPASWKNAVSFRITADSQKLLNEANTKNNMIVVKKTEFTGKEYSTVVSPTP